jgi:hypothetical protein
MSIIGPGAGLLTVQNLTTLHLRMFNVTASAVTISGLTISNCSAGAISNLGGGTLNVTSCSLNANGNGTTKGPGIFNGSQSAGTLNVSNSIIADNDGERGGGIYSEGDALNITNSTIIHNHASGFGGGISNFDGTVTITSSTITGNSSQGGGGGIQGGRMTIANSTIAGNSAEGTGNLGGGIHCGNTQITNCTVTGNSVQGAGGGVTTPDVFDPIGGGTTPGNTTVKSSIIALNTATQSSPDVRGNFFTGGFNLIGKTDGSAGFGAATDQFGDPKLDPNGLQNNGGPTKTIALLIGSPAIDKGTSNGLTGNLTNDQRGNGFPRIFDNPQVSPAAGGDSADIGAYELQVAAGLVANVSTRLQVGKDDDALFEGVIVQGPAGSTKKIIVRGLGPFLAGFQVADPLANPTLDIFQGNTKIATNNDWRTTQLGGLITADQSTEIAMSGFAPSNELESAIIANLAPGSYTAIVRGLGNTTGIGLVDAFDLSASSPAKVVNFATRGLVQPGDKLLTAGFIIQSGPVRAVIRAIGPSLTGPPFNINNALPDTTLQLRDQNANLVQENDDWETDQKAELQATGLQPTNSKEAALVRTIPPGQYTAQVRGKPETTGVGVVEIYFIQ